MKIQINGKEELIENITNLTELINSKNLKPENIVVEHNTKIVSKEEFENVIITEEDKIEIISFVGGG